MAHTPILVTPAAAEPLTLAEAKLHLRQDGVDDDPLVMTLVRAARLEAERITGRSIPAQTWRLGLDRFPYYDGSAPRDAARHGVGSYEFLELRRIRVPRPPLVSVTSITYVDTAGVLQTLDPTLYLVSNQREPGTIEPAYGQVWPVARYQADSVKITWVGGWACTSVALAIAAGTQAVTPASMAGIVAGSVLTIGLGSTQEQVSVSAVAATTFTATFAQAHDAGAKVCGVPDDILAGMKLMLGHWYANREAAGERVLTEVPLAAMHLLMGNDFGSYP